MLIRDTALTILTNILSNFITHGAQDALATSRNPLARALTQPNFQVRFYRTLDTTLQRFAKSYPAYQEPGNQWLGDLLAAGGLHLWLWQQWLDAGTVDAHAFTQEVAAQAKTLSNLPVPEGYAEALHATYLTVLRAEMPQTAHAQVTQQTADTVDQIQLNLVTLLTLCHTLQDNHADGPAIEKALAQNAAKLDDLYGLVQEMHAQIVPPPAEQGASPPFYGRQALRNQLLAAFHAGKPVQILGEHRWGKTTVLDWLARQFPGGPVPWVRLNAERLPTPTPEALMRAVLEATGDQMLEPGLYGPEPSRANVVLDQVVRRHKKLVLLVDNADKLAVDGHGFTVSFFDLCRSLTEDGSLTWVSASRRDLYDLFVIKGLTSAFLNNADKLRLNALMHPEAALFFPDPAQAERVYSLVGGFPDGLVWAKRFLRGNPDGDLSAHYALHMHTHFRQWWQGCDKNEQEVLRLCRTARSRFDLTGRRRTWATGLVLRGLVVEQNGGFHLNGKAWSEYVDAAHD